MSTPCRIGKRNEDGTISSIYCHFDGYVRGGVGEILALHYKDPAKVDELIGLGDLASLGWEPVENPNAWKDEANPMAARAAIFSGKYQEYHEAMHPRSMCDTYRSRKGEGNVSAKKSATLEDFATLSHTAWAYAYLFENGRWMTFKGDSLVPVVKILDGEIPESDDEED